MEYIIEYKSIQYIVEYKGIQSPNYKAVVKNDKFLKLKCYQSCFQSSSRLHTVRITGILNICYHITTMDDNTF